MLEYINNPNVAIINFLADGATPKTCEDWGEEGAINFPIIVDDQIYGLSSWFGITWLSPRHIFIDHELKYYAITNDLNDVDSIIEEMLENLESE